jgi:hypothetical protein
VGADQSRVVLGRVEREGADEAGVPSSSTPSMMFSLMPIP